MRSLTQTWVPLTTKPIEPTLRRQQAYVPLGNRAYFTSTFDYKPRYVPLRPAKLQNWRDGITLHEHFHATNKQKQRLNGNFVIFHFYFIFHLITINNNNISTIYAISRSRSAKSKTIAN